MDTIPTSQKSSDKSASWTLQPIRTTDQETSDAVVAKLKLCKRDLMLRSGKHVHSSAKVPHIQSTSVRTMNSEASIRAKDFVIPSLQGVQNGLS